MKIKGIKYIGPIFDGSGYGKACRGNINALFNAGIPLTLSPISFDAKKPTLDVIIDFEKFKLDAFSPLGEDVFNNIRGFVYGNANLTGLLSNPTMEGDLYLDQAGLYFPYLNVDYDFVGRSVVNLENQIFTFEKVIIKDK